MRWSSLGLCLCISAVVLLCFPQRIVASEEVATPSAEVVIPAPETPINLTVSPISLILEAKPGETVTSSLRLRNNGTSSEQLRLRVGLFRSDESGERPTLLDPKPGDETVSWLKIDEPLVTVNPSEWRTVGVTFTPSKNASLSYYYTIIVERSSVAQSRGGDTVVSGAPALLVLATVDSPFAKRELQVGAFRARWPFVEYLPQEFEIEVKNTGNVHLAPSGNVFIDGQGKKDLAILSLNSGVSQVLPETTRKFVVKWSDGFPVYEGKVEGEKEVLDDKGNPVRTLKWDFSTADRLRIGKYTAHLLMVYDNGERDIPIESFVTFWVIPWKLLLAGLIIILFVGVGVMTTGRSLLRVFRRRRTEEASTEPL